MKETKEKEQYSNAKNRILQKPRHRKIVSFKIRKVKLTKIQCQILLNKINCKQKTSKTQKKNY